MLKVSVLIISLLLFSRCEKAVELVRDISPFDNIAVAVEDTLIDTLKVGEVTSYRQVAYKVSVSDLSGVPVTGSAPVVFNVYRYYQGDSITAESWELVARLFRGANGYTTAGTSKIVYIDNSGVVDTLVYRGHLDTLIVTGSQNKNKFRFAVAALTELSGNNAQPGVYRGGTERYRYVNPVEYGGVLRTTFGVISLDGSRVSTADTRITVRARMNLTGLDTVYIMKMSLYNDRIPFDSLWSLENRLRTIRNLPALVPINAGYKYRLSDSLILNDGNVEVGRYGGVRKIANNHAALSGYFNALYDTIPADSAYGENGWFDGVAYDTLPLGQGTKTVYLYHPTFAEPYYSEIAIRSFSWEINLRASIADSVYRTSQGYLVAGDRIPFKINTFGDTTFDSEVEVWLLTRNLSSDVISVMDVKTGVLGFANPILSESNTQGVKKPGAAWPDVLLETVPEKFRMTRAVGVDGELRPDYELGYKVSPFWYYSVNVNVDSASGDTLFSPVKIYENMSSADISYLSVAAGVGLSFRIKPGSVLGYSDQYLDNPKIQDSAIVSDLGKVRKIPYVGHYSAESIENVFPDKLFDPYVAASRFSSQYNVDISDVAIVPGKSSVASFQTGGGHYMARFAQFVQHPDQPYSLMVSKQPITPYGKASLYKNPMRTLPYYIRSGSNKEFVLCVYSRGKHFKEPRVIISSLGGSPRFYWDKIPPKIDWPASYSLLVKPYAPAFFMNLVTGDIMSTHLEKAIIPYVFDVSVATITDNSSIVSAQLKFFYSEDFQSLDPVTGFRKYSSQGITVDIDRKYLSKNPSTINNAVFPEIDARSWRAGNWDMWIETRDALGNTGIAPMFTKHSDNIMASVRTIKVNE